MIKYRLRVSLKSSKLLMSIISLQYFCYIRDFKIFIFHMHVISLCLCLWLWFLIMIKIEFLFMIFLFLWFILWFVCQKTIVDSLFLLIQLRQITKNDLDEILLSKWMHFFLLSCTIFMFFIHIFLIWLEVQIIQTSCFISCH